MATPLYNRSVYSLLSSMLTPKSIVLKCKEYGYKSAALVDRNVLSGAMSFKKECEKAEIKPIYGLSVDVEIDDRIHEVILYARNDDGYRNLMGLSSRIGISDKKTIDVDTLNRYRGDNFLVLVSDDMPLTYYVDRKMDLEEAYKRQSELFGDDYLVAMADHDIALNLYRDRELKPFLKGKGIKTIALSRSYYSEKNDYEEYEVLKCIRDKRVLLDGSGENETGRHFKSIEEYQELYDSDDLKNTDLLSSMCNVDMYFKTSLPEYKAKADVSPKDYLVSLCKEGLKRRLKGKEDIEYTKILDY